MQLPTHYRRAEGFSDCQFSIRPVHVKYKFNNIDLGYLKLPAHVMICHET